jgi:hypothetical protein
MREAIQRNTEVVVTRSSSDNGANGTYFQSDMSVKVFGIEVNNVKVQSTVSASTGLANNDVTLAKGPYDLTLTAGSGTYLNALQITGNEQSPKLNLRDGTSRNLVAGDNFLIHPNDATNPANKTKFGTVWFPNSFSKGCQIVDGTGGFNETRGILESLGFANGNKTRLIIK